MRCAHGPRSSQMPRMRPRCCDLSRGKCPFPHFFSFYPFSCSDRAHVLKLELLYADLRHSTNTLDSKCRPRCTSPLMVVPKARGDSLLGATCSSPGSRATN